MINLSKYEDFFNHDWVKPLRDRYDRDCLIAKVTIKQVTDVLKEINEKYIKDHHRSIFTTIEGRVKEKNSFFAKLHKLCVVKSKRSGTNPKCLVELYETITDFAGARFSCPYYDEVEASIANLVRPRFGELGYAIDLSEEGLPDKNYLEDGDENGYRSYHFMLKVPAVVSIFGEVEAFYCEIQARSELQHVWAVRSHDLLYKPRTGLEVKKEFLRDMKEISNNLKTMDYFLTRVREEVRGEDEKSKMGSGSKKKRKG